MIFESPDGGKTVFVRAPHTLNKVDITATGPDSQELNTLWFMWRDILTASKDNSALREALDRAQVIYQLSKPHD